MNRRHRLWVGGAAALGAGVLLAGPLRAAAQEDDGDWVSETLDVLVADGTISQAQADAVDQALDAARPELKRGPRGPGRFGGHFGPRIGLDAAATAIGIDEDELRAALRDGQTIAEVAEANGVDVQVVIDAMVAAAQERIDEAIADADGRSADVTERITELVNEGFPQRGERRDHKADDDADDQQPADTTTPPTTTGD